MVAFLAALIVVGSGGWQLVRMREAILRDAEKNTGTLARALAHHAGRTVETVDLNIRDAVVQAESGRDPPELMAYLRSRNPLDQVFNLIIIDASGRWIADTVPPHAPMNSVDRSYFAWHRDHADRGPLVGETVVGKTSGRATIPLSRRINKADGSFGGLVVGTLNPDFFRAFYQTVQLGSHSTIALSLDRGQTLVQVPETPRLMEDVRSDQGSSTAVLQGQAGVSRTRSRDGMERILAFEHVDKYPLVVSVAIAVDDALADWRREAVIEASFVGAAGLLLIGLGIVLERRGRQVKSFERSSREADRQYRLLAENSTDLVALKQGFSSVRSYVSPSARSTVGWEPEELRVLPNETFIHPDDLDRVAAEFASLTPNRPRVTSLHRVRHKDGHHVWLESVFRLTESGDVIIAGRDVTSRRSVEQSLAESESRFRHLAEASSDMIQQLDLTGRRMYVSPAAREIFGLEAADLVGTHPVDLIHPDDASSVSGWISELAVGEREQARSIHRIRHKSGHFAWVDVQFRLVRDKAKGDPLEIVSSVRDVTQREELRQELESANRFLLMAEEIAQVGHWRLELPAYTLTWSSEVYRIHGRDPGSFSPDFETAINLYHADDRAEVDRCVTEAIAEHRSFGYALRILRPDGEVRHVVSRGVCEVDARGATTAIFGTIMDVTDLRQAEHAARQNEAHYRLLADNSTDMITHMDLTGRRLFVSPGSRDLLGHDPEDLVGTSPQQMIHPDDALALRTVFGDLASGSIESAVNVNRLRHKDGRWIWVEASLKLLRGDDGRPSGFVGAIRNIMDRRKAEEEIWASEARYRLLADHSSDLITLKSTFDGVRAYVSPSSRSVIGYDPDELAAIPATELTHPDDRERVAALFASLSPERPKISSVYRVRHKAGHWIWLDVDYQLTNAGQPDQSVIGRARDISARHEAEQALATSEARLGFALESSGQGVWDTDLEHDHAFYSAAWKALLGYADDELETTPLTWLEFMHPDDREAAVRANRHHLEGCTDAFDHEFRMRHKDGHWVWIHDRGKVIRRDENGRPLRMIGIHIDITAKRQSEQELRVAKERAEAGMTAKTEFVANMSHELRTPLTGILGVHDLLGNDPTLSSAHRRLVGIASEAGRSLLAIVNDVLDFSKIDAGQMEIEQVVFDLDAVIASCRDLARESLKGKPVWIVAESSPDILGHFRGDPTRIRQVLLNLLTNAVKFTPRGDITIRTVFTGGTGSLRIDITDSGIGVPADRIGSLFDRFTQADTTMTRRYGGTGLGLAICKRLVDLMGGRIGVESPPKGGSNFWFELPLQRHEGSVATLDARSIASRKSGRRLLLAEDNAVNAQIIAAMLEVQGHAVAIVPDGARAEEAARQQPRCDLILMDLQMPVLDGLSATQAIRLHETRTGLARVPIVGLTANAMVEDAERCLAAGMDAHVAKPVEWAILLATLDRLLGSSDRATSEASNVTNLAEVLESRSSKTWRDRSVATD